MAASVKVNKALKIVHSGKFSQVVETIRTSFKVLRTLQIVSGALADTLPRLIKVWLGVDTDLSEAPAEPELAAPEVSNGP